MDEVYTPEERLKIMIENFIEWMIKNINYIINYYSKTEKLKNLRDTQFNEPFKLYKKNNFMRSMKSQNKDFVNSYIKILVYCY